MGKMKTISMELTLKEHELIRRLAKAAGVTKSQLVSVILTLQMHKEGRIK